MSIPLVVLVSLLISTVLGLAIAIINEPKARILNTNKNGFTLVFQVEENPFVELILNVAFCSFRFQKCHAIATGSNKNNQKNSGFKNEISFIMIDYCFGVLLNLECVPTFVYHIYHLLGA